MFFGTYFFLLLALNLTIDGWKIIDGPSTEIAPILSNYETYLIRQKIRNAIDEIEKDKNQHLAEKDAAMRPSDTRSSSISHNDLYKIIRGMRTRMFGSI